MSEVKSTVASTAIQFVTFQVGQVCFGIDIAYVQEINRQLEVTPIPESNPTILGVVNLRGDVVTVLDPHRIFDIEENPPGEQSRNLILNLGGERIGILVDGVSEILSIDEQELSSRPGNVPEVERKFVNAVYLQENSVVVILDATALIEAVDQSVELKKSA